MGLVVAFLAPALAAFGLVRLLDRDEDGSDHRRAQIVMALCLSLTLGWGLSSCTWFVALCWCGPPGKSFCVAETLGFVAVGMLLLWLSRRAATGGSRDADQAEASALLDGDRVPDTRQERPSWEAKPEWSRGRRLTVVAFVAATAFAVLGFVGQYLTEPHGDWDAWGIWNMRARGVFRAGEDWRVAFNPAYMHADYPLLLPMGNARCWTYLGAERVGTPIIAGVVFTLASIGLLAAGVGRLRGENQGLLAGLALLGTVSFLEQGGSQYADVPLAFFFLAAVLLSAIHDVSPSRPGGLLFLAGLAVGLAAWTKNEGMLMALAWLVARSVVAWRRGGGREVARQWAFAAAGAVPVLVVVALFKYSLAPANDLVSGQAAGSGWTRLANPMRWVLIAGGTIRAIVASLRAHVIILPLCWFFLGKARDYPRLALGGAMATIGLVLAGYLAVYLTTPHDVTWHMKTSADRLLMQVWPAMLLVLFLNLGDPLEQPATGVDSTSGAPSREIPAT